MSASPVPKQYRDAKILILDRNQNETGESIEVKFNPSEYSLDKSVEYGELSLPGMDTPVTQFVSGKAETLSMELLVDRYENQTDVTKHVERLDSLVSVDGDRHAPPLCRFAWGELRFTAVVESLGKQFTLFMPDGRPVRAKISITFKRYETISKQRTKERRSSPDRTKVRRVTADDSLWSLAAAEYGDAGRWRHIADANGLTDPRRLDPGTELVIPPLDS